MKKIPSQSLTQFFGQTPPEVKIIIANGDIDIVKLASTWHLKGKYKENMEHWYQRTFDRNTFTSELKLSSSKFAHNEDEGTLDIFFNSMSHAFSHARLEPTWLPGERTTLSACTSHLYSMEHPDSTGTKTFVLFEVQGSTLKSVVFYQSSEKKPTDQIWNNTEFAKDLTLTRELPPPSGTETWWHTVMGGP